MTNHTPMPWESYPIENRRPYYGLRRIGHEKNCAEIVDTFLDTAVLIKEDAELIVKSVNCHEQLVQALEATMWKLATYEGDADEIKLAQTVIAAAKGETK